MTVVNFIYFNWISILIPFIVGLFVFGDFDKNLKIIFIFVCFGTLNEVVTRLLIGLTEVHNTMPLLHLYGIVSFVLLFVFYYDIIGNYINPRVFIILSLLFAVCWIVNSIFIQSIYEFPAMLSSLGDILIILLSIIYFYKIMLEAKIIKLAGEPLIWINAAILIYYAGNLFFYVLFNLILEYSREFSKITVIYFSVLNTLFYLLIAIGFSKVKQKVRV